MKIGVTGANGFVGGYLLAALRAAGHETRALVRTPERLDAARADEIMKIPSLERTTDPEILKPALEGLDAVVHLAARVHVMNATRDDDMFSSVNVGGSAALFAAARASGIRRFVFLSSVKAAGERSGTAPLSDADMPAPEDAYGRSKLEAETLLQETAKDMPGGLVILRPAFVYGWPASGNFKTVVAAILKGIPLPLAGIRNRRDMTYAGNLADAIVRACEVQDLRPAPYFVSDGVPVSTPELFRQVGKAFARPARLFYMPLWALKLAGALTGRGGAISRLSENFVVDCSPFHRDARWQPPYKMSEGLGAVARAWQETNRAGPV